jgi:DNA excision repair protein ERCC-4
MPEIKLQDLVAIIDTREQCPWDLSPMRTEAGTLSVGDYSLAGMERIIAIERKSLADFVSCCGSERERFQRELDRLRGWPVGLVIIEANYGDIEAGQWRSKLTAGQVLASLSAWVAQGHRIILARDAEAAAKFARGVMFYAARYRLREVAAMLGG